MDKIKATLKRLRINRTADFSGTRITAVESSNGCIGCMFRPKLKSLDCRFRDSCLAHKRPDRKSVLFKPEKL